MTSGFLHQAKRPDKAAQTKAVLKRKKLNLA
jgi:hypothetical protein